MIILAGRYEIVNPEERVRDYCRVEIYRGYDDQHSVDNTITENDVRAANRLFARIKPDVAKELINSNRLRDALVNVRNIPLGEMSPEEWEIERKSVASLLECACSIKGVRLAVATKIFYLKRPKLFPILDSFVVKFLLGVELDKIHKSEHPRIGLEAMEVIQNDLLKYRLEFQSLREKLNDLPIPLEDVRIYDILAWSTEKWDVRGNVNTPFRKAVRFLTNVLNMSEKTLLEPAAGGTSKTINEKTPNGTDNLSSGSGIKKLLSLDEFDAVVFRGTGYIAITDSANPTRIHKADCQRLRRDWFKTKVVINRGRNGSYFFSEDYSALTYQFSNAILCSKCRPDQPGA